MKKLFVCILMTAFTLPVFAQRGNIETDIFGDLKYEYRNDNYRAAFKQDIFDNLTFTDSRDNKIVLEKKYLDLEYPGVLADNEAKTRLFRSLIRRHSRDNDYKATHSVDIFGTVKFTDNRGNKTETGTDIFGNTTYKEQRNGQDLSVSRDFNGALQYRSGGDTASLGKDIFGKWIYKDSGGNKFEFSDKAWHRLIHRFGDEEKIFIFLTNEYLRD